jgi:hypothetical protein
MTTAQQDLTRTEQLLVTAYCDAIRAVCSVERYITNAPAVQLDTLEAEVGMPRADELRTIAERRMFG